MRIASTAHAEQATKRALFELIENKEHWKKPIHAYVPKHLFSDFSSAAAYFHGEGLKAVSEADGWTEVKNQGYVCW